MGKPHKETKMELKIEYLPIKALIGLNIKN